MKNAGLFLGMLLVGVAALPVRAADTDALTKNGVLDRLVANTGVYNKSKTGKAPGFVSDPSWPKNLPHSWLLGQVGGLYVDQHDHIWVYNRPRTLTTDEAGLEDAVPGAKNNAGVPIDGIGHPRPYGLASRIAARRRPQVLERSSIPKAICCRPGVVPPIPAGWPPIARNPTAASGPIPSTAFISTRMTMSGWAVMAARLDGLPAAAARRK